MPELSVHQLVEIRCPTGISQWWRRFAELGTGLCTSVFGGGVSREGRGCAAFTAAAAAADAAVN